MTRTRHLLASALLATVLALSLAVAPGHAHRPAVAEGTADASQADAPPACRSTHCRATEQLLPTIGTMPTSSDSPARVDGAGRGPITLDQRIRGAARP